MSTVLIDPSVVYFTFSRIRPQFSCGRTIQSTLESIQRGELDVNSLPTITILHDPHSGHFFSLNNRRLYLFKKLKEMGLIQAVQARLKAVPDTRRMGEKYSAEKCSRTATLMGGVRNGTGEGGAPQEVDGPEEEEEEGEEQNTELGAPTADGASHHASKKNQNETKAVASAGAPTGTTSKPSAKPSKPKPKNRKGEDDEADNGAHGSKVRSLEEELQGLRLGGGSSSSEEDSDGQRPMQQAKSKRKGKRK